MGGTKLLWLGAATSIEQPKVKFGQDSPRLLSSQSIQHCSQGIPALSASPVSIDTALNGTA
jgi:hypothetical protein